MNFGDKKIEFRTLKMDSVFAVEEFSIISTQNVWNVLRGFDATQFHW